MPVVVVQEKQINKQLLASLARVINDLESSHPVAIRFSELSQGKNNDEVWVGVFNERVVAFALVENSIIKAIAVHKATRNRGVGSRLLEQLLVQNTDLSIDFDENDPWLKRFYRRFKKEI